jgi:hypothetical protein
MKTTAKIQEEKKDKRKAIYASLIFLKLLILFFLLVSMDQPDPPLQEEIIEVEIDFGGASPSGSPSSAETSQAVNNTVTESAQEIDQQDESPVIQQNGKGDNSNSEKTKPVEEAKPDDTFKFQSNSGKNGGKDDGNEFGTQPGKNGLGTEGVDKDDGSVNLKRKITDNGGITAQSQEEGKVAIDIWVNDKGEVVKTKFNAQGSNTPSKHLKSLATKWAKTMQYEKSLGSPIQYVGYQVFSFTKH